MNGKIIRMRPLHFDWQYKPSDFNYGLWSITAKNGKVFTPPLKTLVPPYHLAYKKRAISPNRVKYPLKRVDWNPGGPSGAGYNPQNRGKSKFVRISWDDALNYVSSELKRVVNTYGSLAIYDHAATFHGESNNAHGRGGSKRVCNLAFGPVVDEWRDPDSWEGWYWGSNHMWGFFGGLGEGMQGDQNLVIVDTFQNTDLCIFVGADPEVTPWGWGGQMAGLVCYWLKQAGKHVIYITPGLNHAANIHADKWIPVNPNTDFAWQMAVAYVWITEGTYDKNFVATHTFGFDETMMPAGVAPNSSFKSYVLGLSDGIPKTPKWAEGLCGIPSRIIKALAREWASKTTSCNHGNGGGYIRGPYSHEPARGEASLLTMQGIGKPGVNQVKWIEWMTPGPTYGSAFIPSAGAAQLSYGGFGGVAVPGVNDPGLQKNLLAKAILNGTASWYGHTFLMSPPSDQFIPFTYPSDGKTKIRLQWHETTNQTSDWNSGGMHMFQAYRDPTQEFIFYQVPWLENDALFGDIILPVAIGLEKDIDIQDCIMTGQFSTLVLENQTMPPVGESKTDLEIFIAIADKLGVKDAFTTGLANPSHDLVKAGFNNSGVQNVMTYDQFAAKQYYVVPVNPNWATALGPVGVSAYYNLATGTGLMTPSGKIEFFCQDLYKAFPNDTERPPLAHYPAAGITHQETLQSPRAKLYPLLFVSPHVRWRTHSEHDDISWTREIHTCKVRASDGYQYEPIWIHPVDAAKRGIKDGDIVAMYNERGTVLGGAYVTERIMPGSVWEDHASRQDPITSDTVWIDRGGSGNTILPEATVSQNCAGLVGSGVLVEVKKADMADLMAKYPAAFARPFDPAAGPSPAQTWVSS